MTELGRKQRLRQALQSAGRPARPGHAGQGMSTPARQTPASSSNRHPNRLLTLNPGAWLPCAGHWLSTRWRLQLLPLALRPFGWRPQMRGARGGARGRKAHARTVQLKKQTIIAIFCVLDLLSSAARAPAAWSGPSCGETLIKAPPLVDQAARLPLGSTYIASG